MSYYVRTIILFLIIPSECSLPTNMLTNIAMKSPIYIIYSLINASNVTVAGNPAKIIRNRESDYMHL